jgi:hypothetical protein
MKAIILILIMPFMAISQDTTTVSLSKVTAKKVTVTKTEKQGTKTIETKEPYDYTSALAEIEKLKRDTADFTTMIVFMDERERQLKKERNNWVRKRKESEYLLEKLNNIINTLK